MNSENKQFLTYLSKTQLINKLEENLPFQQKKFSQIKFSDHWLDQLENYFKKAAQRCKGKPSYQYLQFFLQIVNNYLKRKNIGKIRI